MAQKSINTEKPSLKAGSYSQDNAPYRAQKNKKLCPKALTAISKINIQFHKLLIKIKNRYICPKLYHHNRKLLICASSSNMRRKTNDVSNKTNIYTRNCSDHITPCPKNLFFRRSEMFPQLHLRDIP